MVHTHDWKLYSLSKPEGHKVNINWTYWILYEVNNASIESAGTAKDDAALDHEVNSGDGDGKDGPRVVRVGEVPKPQGKGYE